ncbi:ABC transporter permease [Alistipes ihumii]|uniref:ABC transporter permease n=1 Tax=Alistipes ihumii TaxID=1470347 RepID=UPI003AF1D80F
MSYFRAFRNAFVRELRSFGSHKFFYMLSLGLPILSFLFFILLFRTGVPRDMPVAVLDQDNSPLSRRLTRMIDATPSARVVYQITDMKEGERMMKQGKIDAIIQIPSGLEKNVYSNTQARVMAYINGLNLTKNGLLNKDILTVATTFSSGIQLQTLMKKGLSETEAYNQMMPIYFEKHILFNPYTNYSYYLLPSFLPLMLMLFALLTAVFTIGVELKNGTASEWLAASGGHTSAALAGKLAPYTVIFFVLCLLMDTLLFKYVDVPLNGSVSMLLVSGLFFVLASQGIGAFIVILLSNLRLGLSIGGGYSVLSFTFSGLTFPFLAMDLPVRIVGYLFPMTYYMDLFIDQGMRGAPTADSAIYLVGLAAFLLLPWTVILRLRKICTEEKYWGRL